MRRVASFLPVLAVLPLLAASAGPGTRALGGVQPGLWEVSRSATGQEARRICLREVEQLATIGHAGEHCERTVLGDRTGMLVVDLQCPRGEFARSRISVITPRSLKLESQGIHRGEPFDMTLYARRVGSCRPI